jgi:hypothetical protein
MRIRLGPQKSQTLVALLVRAHAEEQVRGERLAALSHLAERQRSELRALRAEIEAASFQRTGESLREE